MRRNDEKSVKVSGKENSELKVSGREIRFALPKEGPSKDYSWAHTSSVATVAAVAIATVPVVLGWVVVWRVDWCHWRGWRIQANDAATLARAVHKYFDRPSNDAILASKVLQESFLSERLLVVLIRASRNVVNPSSNRSSRWIRGVVGVFERVELGSGILTLSARV